MAKVTIIYGSTTSNTESAAKDIAAAISGHTVSVMDVSNASKADFEDADVLILGTSTWGLGDIQDDWDAKLSVLQGANIAGKKVAIFGLGDSASYGDTFVDGVGIIYETVQNCGVTVIGSVSVEGYSHSSSRAEIDGVFVGLPLDDDTADMNGDRIATWVADITTQF